MADDVPVGKPQHLLYGFSVLCVMKIHGVLRQFSGRAVPGPAARAYMRMPCPMLLMCLLHNRLLFISLHNDVTSNLDLVMLWSCLYQTQSIFV